jgi:hypothetical protein
MWLLMQFMIPLKLPRQFLKNKFKNLLHQSFAQNIVDILFCALLLRVIERYGFAQEKA